VRRWDVEGTTRERGAVMSRIRFVDVGLGERVEVVAVIQFVQLLSSLFLGLPES
jgi:hypothetical protein